MGNGLCGPTSPKLVLKKRGVAAPEPRKNAPREAASPKKAKAASPAKKKKAAPASPAKKPKKAAKKTTAPRPTAAPTRKPAAKKKKSPKAPRAPAAAEVATPVVTTTRSGRRSFGALDWWRSERIVVRPGQNAVVVAGSAAAEDYLGAAKSF